MPSSFVFAVVTIGTILARRPHELGGNKAGAQATAAFFCLLWIMYVVLSALVSYKIISNPLADETC